MIKDNKATKPVEFPELCEADNRDYKWIANRRKLYSLASSLQFVANAMEAVESEETKISLTTSAKAIVKEISEVLSD